MRRARVVEEVEFDVDSDARADQIVDLAEHEGRYLREEVEEAGAVSVVPEDRASFVAPAAVVMPFAISSLGG